MSNNDPVGMQRGDYGRSLPGPLLLASCRILSAPLQWFLINSHPLSRFGVPPPPAGGTLTIPFLSSQPLPQMPLIMASLPAVATFKQLIWLGFLCNERVTVPFGFFGSLSSIIYESVSSLIFTAAAVNPLFSDRFFYAGAGLFVTSIVAELVCEVQRAAFKAQPRNQGRLCTTGLWAWCRHPNYAANIAYGFAFGLAAGGPLYGLATGGMYFSNLAFNATPSLEKYCAEKYKEEWLKYEKKVPWKLFPGFI